MSVTSEPSVISLWPPGAPEPAEWPDEEQPGLVPPNDLKVIRNITRPTLTAYLPRPAARTGAAVVVCPGGGFHFVAFEHEGTDVADWLVQRGIAAFVLKYRVLHTTTDGEELMAEVWRNVANAREHVDRQWRQASADGREAVRIVRQRAAEWGIAPNRIGVLGFSAGGMIAARVALEHDAGSRPDFVAPIYGAPWGDVVVPADAPPMFIALAGDDDFAVPLSLSLYSAWRAAGRPVELHVYARGGHGFGMRKQGLPADGWIDRFADWLGAQGMLSAPG